MNFGEKLRQLRNDKDLTQPQLAAAMGIEQSYLSKLENEKSLPSNDVLKRILDVFNIGVGDLVNDLDQGTRNQLRQIPDVADHFNHQKQQLIGSRKRWLLLSALLMSFGIALIYAGSTHLFYSDIVYQYKSQGVVLEGESKEIFDNPGYFFPQAADQKNKSEFLDAVTSRIDEVYLLSSQFRGRIFNVDVDGGSRTYHLEDETEIDPWQSKLVVFVGILMLVFGLIGFVLERRLTHQQW